jgi:hypothetical protein
MKIKFDKSAIESFINQSINETWNISVQDNAYKQLLKSLKNEGYSFDSKQELAIKKAVNYTGALATKQALIAMLRLFDKLGLLQLDS